MVVIIHPDVDIWNFILADLATRTDVRLFPFRRNTSCFERVVRRMLPTSSVPASLLFRKDLCAALSSLAAGDSVVLCDYTEPILLLAINHLIDVKVARYCWQWNHFGRENASFVRHLSYMRQLGFVCMTYDEVDATYYQLQYHPQFFCIRRFTGKTPQQAPLWDFYFVGQAKERTSEIREMQLLLAGFETCIKVVSKPDEFISYDHYMKQAGLSRCIVDIVCAEAPSCSLRPLEALSLHRKLITNNSNIRNYAFYHPQNIFIAGEDDASSLTAFIHSPFVELPAEVIDSYDVSHWIEAFK